MIARPEVELFRNTLFLLVAAILTLYGELDSRNERKQSGIGDDYSAR